MDVRKQYGCQIMRIIVDKPLLLFKTVEIMTVVAMWQTMGWCYVMFPLYQRARTLEPSVSGDCLTCSRLPCGNRRKETKASWPGNAQSYRTLRSKQMLLLHSTAESDTASVRPLHCPICAKDPLLYITFRDSSDFPTLYREDLVICLETGGSTLGS